MKDDVSWAKSPRFAGATSIAAGFLLIAGAVFLCGAKCAWFGLLVCITVLIADVVYSYRISK